MTTPGDTNSKSQPTAAMSIDVEDWFHVENLKSVIRRDDWDSKELRVERNTDQMLQWMAERDVRCTCFILGWVAERRPELIRRIADAGHEIACHGYGHDLIYNLSEEQFDADIDRSTKLLRDITGASVTGYRAPSFSITDWALPILRKHGIRYDSSAFPTVAHDRYGKLSGMDAGEPIVELSDGFHEVCISTLQLGKRGFPWGGGGYFRLIPYPVFRRGVRRILGKGDPYVFYIHPWEIDHGQPRVKGLKQLHAFRHYNNLDRCGARFQKLLSEFQWSTISAMVDEFIAMTSSDPPKNTPKIEGPTSDPQTACPDPRVRTG